MKRSKKSNKVSWPRDVDLCQVRLFLSDDCPSQVGLAPQDHLQKKTSWILHSNTMDSNDLPPGFEGSHNVNQLKGEFSLIPRIIWKCPPKFVLSHSWQVAAGEESEETGAQKLRELTVLEAVYPRPSAIPSSPSVSSDIEDCHHDDCHTPVVPITPIEEDEATHLPSDFVTPSSTSTSLPPAALPQVPLASGVPHTVQSNCPALNPPPSEKPALGTLPSLEADVVAAASAALTAIMKSNEQGSLIDTNLLIKILNNPKMIEKLINGHGAPTNTQTLPVPASKLVTPSSSLSTPEPDEVSPPRLANGNLDHFVNGVRPTSIAIPPQQEAFAHMETALVPRSKPVTSSVPLSSPETRRVLSPIPPSENLHYVPNGMRPNLITVPPQLQLPAITGTSPISTVKQVSLRDPLHSSETRTALTPRPANGNVRPLPNGLHSPAAVMLSQQSNVPIYPSAVKPPPVKDVNYYKNLVKQHGGERQETQDHSLLQYGISHSQSQDPKLAQNFKPIELTPKIQKPCIYFNSSKGCRNGSSCPFQHAMPVQWRAGSILEAQTAKRMKLREITGGR